MTSLNELYQIREHTFCHRKGQKKKHTFCHLILPFDIQAAEIIDSTILECLVLSLRSKVGRVKRFATGEPHGSCQELT